MARSITTNLSAALMRTGTMRRADSSTNKEQ
jgi:hypothetical protein